MGADETDLDTQAVQWRTITTPEQLRVLNLKSEGFGPGYYKIGADFTLGDQPTGDLMATCGLLSGTFVIDFNGHTVQSSCESLATFTVQGANVTFMDSKASDSKVSVNALGIGCIELREGSVTVVSGNYLCDKFTDAGGSALYNGNGTLNVNGGAFKGSQTAVATAGGTTVINGGTFYGGYPWALLYMAGDTKIVRGTFIGGQTYYGRSFAISALTLGNAFDMSTLLASGSTWDNVGQYYCTATTSDVSMYPGYSYTHAVTAGSTVVVSGPQDITVPALSKTFGDKPFSLGAKSNGDGALSYSSSNRKVATVNGNGTVTMRKAGTTKITVNASETATSKAASKTVTLKVKKAANTAVVKGLTATVSAKNLAKKKQVTKALVKVTKAKGGVTFAKKSGSKALSINKSTGKVTVKKHTKQGTYRMVVKASVAGNANYNKTTKTVKVVVWVK